MIMLSSYGKRMLLVRLLFEAQAVLPLSWGAFREFFYVFFYLRSWKRAPRR